MSSDQVSGCLLFFAYSHFMDQVFTVEQKVLEVLEICERVYSTKLGKNAFVGEPGESKGDKGKLKELFL